MAHFCFHAQHATSVIFCCIVQSTYHKLLKIHHHFTHYLEAKVGMFVPIFHLSDAHAPSLRSSQSLIICMRLIIMTIDAASGRKQLCWTCTREISSICAVTKLRGIISMWRQETTRCKLVFLGRVQATKVMAVVCEWDYSNFVCTCLGTQWTTELIKSSLKEDVQYGALTWGNKISV